MKKPLSALTALIIISAILLVGCGRNKGTTTATVKVGNPYTLDFQTDEDAMKFYTQGDSMEMLVASTPFYFGAHSLPGKNGAEYEKARESKVREIVSEADALMKAAGNVDSSLARLREIYLDYLSTCLKSEPKLATFAKESTEQVVLLKSREAVARASVESISTSSENAFARSYMEYTRVMKAVELGGLYLQDANNLLGFSALALESLQGGKKAEIVKAGKQFDADVAECAEDLSAGLADVADRMQRIDNGLKQLKTGDYYFARASVRFMRESVPGLRSKLESVKPGSNLSEQEIADIEAALASFERAAESMQESLDSVPKSELVSVSPQPHSSLFPAAYADGDSQDYANACTAVSQAAEGGIAKRLLSLSWGGIKEAFHGTQSVIGAASDVAGVGMEAVARVACGLYYKEPGQSMVQNLKDSWGDIKASSAEIMTNWEQNKSGAQTMRDAQAFFEKVEGKADEMVAAGVAKMVGGEGWTSWGMGKIAKITTGMFTGLGKGISMVANREADASDIVLGTLEIACAMTGGSKMVVKGSQVPTALEGFGEGAWIAAKKSATLLKKFVVEAQEAGLKKSLVQLAKSGAASSADDVAVLTGQLMAKQALATSLSATNKALTAQLKELAETAVTSAAKNAASTVKGSLSEWVEEQFEASIKGVAKAMASTAGGSATGFLDNVAGSVADNMIKEMVAEAMASSDVTSGSRADGAYKGSFSGGASGAITIVIKDKSVSGSLSGRHTDGSVSGSIGGGFDSASGAIRCSLSGTLTVKSGGTTHQVPFSGSLSGAVGGTSASGSWNTTTEFGSASGAWRASR